MIDDKVLKIINLSLTLENKQILNDISFNAHKGDLIGIIGPNGSGKSTLLKCINGLIKTKRKIKIQDKFIEEYKANDLAKKITIMNQNTFINFPFKSLEIVLMGRYPYIGKFKSESEYDKNISLESMTKTETIAFKDKEINHISGGERQRILCSKTIAQETELILFDEPISNLDLKYQETLLQLFKSLSKDNKTIIVAIHDIKIASKFCSKLILLKSGKILSKGTPKKVLTNVNISKAYDINALSFTNSITNCLDFQILNKKQPLKKHKLHVISGGNSSSHIFKLLYEENFEVTTGVLNIGDFDLESADYYNFESIVEYPFSNISNKNYKKNINLIKASDITILSNISFGFQNILNLKACCYSCKLVIIEDSPPNIRDFTKGKALEMYSTLNKTATITESKNLINILNTLL
ncbi:MAG: ABC transporter ATP-binding protein [Clostridiales bacterium]